MARLDDKPDQGVFEKYGLRGFPTVMMLDSKGEKLLDFRPSTEGETLAAIEDASVLQRSAAALAANPNDAVATAELKIVQALRGTEDVSAEDLKAAAMVSGVADTLKKRAEEHLARKPVLDAVKNCLESMQKAAPGDREALGKEMGNKLYEMCKSGAVAPEVGSMEWFYYWMLVTEGALANKDKETGMKALDALENSPMGAQLKPQLDQKRKEFDDA